MYPLLWLPALQRSSCVKFFFTRRGRKASSVHSIILIRHPSLFLLRIGFDRDKENTEKQPFLAELNESWSARPTIGARSLGRLGALARHDMTLLLADARRTSRERPAISRGLIGSRCARAHHAASSAATALKGERARDSSRPARTRWGRRCQWPHSSFP